MPRSAQMGWESLNLSGNGVDRYIGPLGATGPIHSVQISLVMSNAATNPQFVGQAAALVRGYFTPDAPQFSAPSPAGKQVPLVVPANGDWGQATIYDPNGVASSGDGPGGWGYSAFGDDAMGLAVFSIVMSAQLPAPDVVREQIILPDNTIIPAGSYFVLHVDELTIPANANVNFESQATIFYG